MAEEEKKEYGEKETDEKILEDARKYLKECVDEESTERAMMMDDLRFCTLDQWPQDIRNERENDIENGPRPCLTIDKINQYIVQVVNDIRQGKPGINVRPQDDTADVETAKILKGLIRNIEDQSNADIAYATAAESAAKIGVGYFRITTEYVSEDSFDQEIFIRPIPNTFSVYLGKHVMPDGSDAERGYIIESMPIGKFRAEFPKAKHEEKDFEGLDTNVISQWKTGETITVVEEYCIKSTPYELLFLDDGTSMSYADYAKWPQVAGSKPGVQDRRWSSKRQLKWRKLTGVEVLDKRDLPGKFIPIVEVVGRESHIEGRRILWGLVRPAKDSLRMYNYFASTITEKMALAPKSPFVGAKGQFEGLEEKWRRANKANFAYLEYNPTDVNGNALPRPERMGATPMEAALLQQMQVIEHDVQTSLGMFKAAVGETESQQSGRAILALQRESDTGTYHFGANQGVSIRHGGRIIVDLIPHYYDTKRVVRILGEDGEVTTAEIDPQQEEAHRQIQTPKGLKSIYNPSVGKYDVSITVGPCYNTKRMEAAATLTEIVKSQPQLMPMIGDLLFRSLDFPYSDQIAARMKKMLPPQLQDQNDNGAKLQQQLMQATQALQMMQAQMQELGQENMQLKAGAQEKMAKVEVDREAKVRALALEDAVAKEEARIAREKAERELSLKEWIAQREIEIKRQVAQADTRTDLIEIQTDAKLEVREQDIEADLARRQLAIDAQMAERAARVSEQKQQQAPKGAS